MIQSAYATVASFKIAHLLAKKKKVFSYGEITSIRQAKMPEHKVA